MFRGTLFFVFVLLLCGHVSHVVAEECGSDSNGNNLEVILNTKSGQLKGKCQNVLINEPKNTPADTGKFYFHPNPMRYGTYAYFCTFFFLFFKLNIDKVLRFTDTIRNIKGLAF